jgi:predicted Zn-dependent protease with MMP-like domain
MLFASLASGRVLADGQDLAAYSARIQHVAHQLVENIRPVLDPHAQQVLDDIVFEAPHTWITNAGAHRGFGSRRIVEFNAGFLAVTDWLSRAMIADWAGHPGCLKDYSEYLSELVGHNSRRTWNGKARKHVHDFAEYAASTRGPCQGALTNSLDARRQQELREQILDSVIATVLLHEIGHHVLDHLGGYGNGNFMQRRLREMDADRWAIITAVKANYELRTAVPLFLFIAATGGGTLEDEIRSSHPSGLRRVRDLLVQTRALLDSRDPANAHMLDASIDDLNRSLR